MTLATLFPIREIPVTDARLLSKYCWIIRSEASRIPHDPNPEEKNKTVNYIKQSVSNKRIQILVFDLNILLFAN